MIKLRHYQPSDLAAVRHLFCTTISQVNATDYSVVQRRAWIGDWPATKQVRWQRTFQRDVTFVAVDGSVIVGVANMTVNGDLDCLYVAADHQRQGIATCLVAALERSVPVDRYTVAASITARPFFSHHGYHLVHENVVVRQGVQLTNYTMCKAKLAPSL